jgi:hypothetical protein
VFDVIETESCTCDLREKEKPPLLAASFRQYEPVTHLARLA